MIFLCYRLVSRGAVEAFTATFLYLCIFSIPVFKIYYSYVYSDILSELHSVSSLIFIVLSIHCVLIAKEKMIGLLSMFLHCLWTFFLPTFLPVFFLSCQLIYILTCFFFLFAFLAFCNQSLLWEDDRINSKNQSSTL